MLGREAQKSSIEFACVARKETNKNKTTHVVRKRIKKLAKRNGKNQ